MTRPLRIGINAQISSGSGAGGIETVLRVLTSLSRFGGDEEYVFIGRWSDSEWLRPLLGDRQRLVIAPRPRNQIGTKRAERLKSMIGPLRPVAKKVKDLVLPSKPLRSQIPLSDGFFESLECDVIHFPYQDYIQCTGVPTIYNPHDLQHLHYPDFFSTSEFERREIIYPAACIASRTIVTASQFVKQDIIENYGTEASKIEVIPWAAPELKLDQKVEIDDAKLLKKYDCPSSTFVLYPAMTWEHKNHLRLIEAIYLLRERDGLLLNLVCTGHKNSFYPQIEKRLRQLNLNSHIRFTGIVEHKELERFYKLSRFVAVPTLFEAASAPLFEAWQHGTAVTCSSVTSLPEQAGEAARLFDPLSVESIAEALKSLWLDEDLRASYVKRGTERLLDFSLERTIKMYREVYKNAAERN